MEASGRIPVTSDPAHCAADLLECAVHMLLHRGFFGCSQDPSLGMCLERQSWVRLAAKLCLLHVSDLSPWISQNLGLLWGSQDPFIPPGAHLLFHEARFDISTHSKGGSPGVRGVAWQHQAPSLSRSQGYQAPPERSLCLLGTSQQKGHCWVCSSVREQRKVRQGPHSSNGVILLCFCHIMCFFWGSLTVLMQGGEHTVVCDLLLCCSFRSCSAELWEEVASYGLVQQQQQPFSSTKIKEIAVCFVVGSGWRRENHCFLSDIPNHKFFSPS